MTSEDRIRKADDLLYEIFNDFSLFNYLNPNNSQDEQSKFLERWHEKKGYNPLFEYPVLPEKLPDWKVALRGMELGTSSLEAVFDSTRMELLRVLELLEKRGTEELATVSARLYGNLSDPLVGEAEGILKESRKPQASETPEIGVKGVVEQLRERLKIDRIEGWAVVEDPHSPNLAQVDWAHHKIRVMSGMLITQSMLNRLIHHQIEIHVYRAVNGERQPYKLFAIGLDGYLETEEGLALDLEERMGLMSPIVRRRYAGRVIATQLTQKQSFFDIVSILVKSFSVEEAYALTQRSKRGVADTSRPGGFVQDHIYLQGQKKVISLSNEEHRFLFAGKVATHHLPLVRELIAQKKLFEPAFLPNAFHG